MEIVLTVLCLTCVALAAGMGYLTAMFNMERDDSDYIMPQHKEKPSSYESQLRNLFNYNGTDEGQVKIDED